MKEKFKKLKFKQYFFSITIVVACLTVIFIGSSLIRSEKEKIKKEIEYPKVKYIEKSIDEGKNFKKIYDEELLKIRNYQKNMEIKIQEINKKIRKKSNLISNDKFINKEKTSVMLNNLKIEIPKESNYSNENIVDIKNNLNETPVKETEIKKVIQKNLLIIDGNFLKEKLNINNNKKMFLKKEENIEYIIPATTFVKGVLLNGLDAPTSGNAKNDPHPLAINIIENANMPNGFKSNIKQCRVMASAYGELSSQRAIVRVESLTCITKNKKILISSEKNSIAYVTGEDGKIGLSGRVVSKQGAILARTLAAGFVEGLGEMFKQSSENISASPNGIVTSVKTDKVFKAGVYGGFNSASKKLSQYYLKLNDQMFPVVEINIGRKCDIIFTKSIRMKEIKI